MTQNFILDENVVIYAQRGLDQHDNPNPDCADLVHRIIDHATHVIVVDDILWDKYDHQLNNPAYHHAEYGPYLMLTLWHSLQIPGKIDGLGHTAPPFPEENDIPQGSQDDVFLVRLAVETRAILVTTDQPLRTDLATSGIQSQYNLNIQSPESALTTL